MAGTVPVGEVLLIHAKATQKTLARCTPQVVDNRQFLIHRAAWRLFGPKTMPAPGSRGLLRSGQMTTTCALASWGDIFSAQTIAPACTLHLRKHFMPQRFTHNDRVNFA